MRRGQCVCPWRRTGSQDTWRLTTDAMLANSLSAVMGADWTRNLSLHFASSGGSDFIACRRTNAGVSRHAIPCCCLVATQRTRDIKVLARLDTARIWSNAVPIGEKKKMLDRLVDMVAVESQRRGHSYCLGAVVFT